MNEASNIYTTKTHSKNGMLYISINKLSLVVDYFPAASVLVFVVDGKHEFYPFLPVVHYTEAI